MQVLRMRSGISFALKPAGRRRLEALAQDRNTPHKHVWRAEIVLLSVDGVGTNEIMRRTGKSKTCVWRWQERFMQEGYDGLLRDKTRPSRIPAMDGDTVERVVALTQTDPPAEATHWTSGMMAKAVGISASSVQRIWRAHGLEPHKVKRFKLSNDPQFIEKLRDVVGLYVAPPALAVILSLDEKSQIQALDRTQPGLPMKQGRAGTMTHDYKRHGTRRCSPPSTSSTAQSSDATCNATVTRSSSAFSIPSTPRYCHQRRSTPSSTTTPHPQPSKCAQVVGTPSPLDLPLHANLGIVAQRHRGILRQTRAPKTQAWGLHIRRRS